IKREEGKKVSAQVSRDDFSALIDNLISDKDGSFTKQVIADNKNIVAALDAKVQEKIIQEQQNMAQEVQQKANEQSFGGRSLG
ncbi:TPA: hypothetical protein ACQWFI_001868, partial [Neisseria subflava]